jgi:hypothetical protein
MAIRVTGSKRSKRWVVSTLERWVELGCPSRRRFEQLTVTQDGTPGRSRAM